MWINIITLLVAAEVSLPYGAVDAARVAAIPARTVARRAHHPLSPGTGGAGALLSLGDDGTPPRDARQDHLAGCGWVAQ
jgi:hypothetical protein